MKEERRKISILGIGWLGFPLAKKLIETGYDVKGSTTSESKLELLESNNIQPFQIELSENEIKGNIVGFLENSEVLIIDIPPKLRSNPTENFVEKIKLLIAEVEKSTVKKVLFISSTSVYADAFPIVEIDENTIPNSDSESGKQLVQTEDLLLSNNNFQITILRFGGLIGEDRHPIKFLAGKKDIENPDAPINLIHQEDCIGIICEILNQVQYDSLVLNAVSPHHPTRKEYYTQKAIENNLTLPEFDESKKSLGKLINSKKVLEFLNYKFKREDLF
ncbi:SDR family NAD(P)-dependent oxidoreductase [uncultured Flavobacterium sp.]|uniref:SDR family NAD(P)-dependent oxidoreductase n=1 Tax=uncultured Flavobacterium sp. TaxID=165435 RepID=UPI0030EEC56F|tara:strand:- start:53519 stop:54346 length:828 start_codon:yes stop_codon:yes gene_type:complete